MRRRVLQWVLALGVVALATVLAFGYAQYRATPLPRQTATAEGPSPTTQIQPTLGPLPSNWTRLLPQYRVTDNGGSSGIVASAARLGRVAACALPPANQSGTPVFALSDDGGHTWQTYPVSVLSKVSSCAILANTRRPDIFILGHAAFGTDYDDTPAAITTDGGRTWRALAWPLQAQIALGGSALIDGHLINLRQKTPPFRCTVRAGDEWRSGSPCAILSTYRRACGN